MVWVGIVILFSKISYVLMLAAYRPQKRGTGGN
jgi:hypothetical protein